MRILWITNIIFPSVCKELGLNEPVMGGWMYSSAYRLYQVDANIKLAVATVYNGTELKTYLIDNITYYLLPLRGKNIEYHKRLEELWKQVVADFKPDIAHLHGTEYAHGLAFIKACPEVKIVVSIQGLVSVYSKYYYAGLSKSDILKSITFRDLVKFDTVFQQKNEFRKRGLIEKEIISKSHHVIGRTSWDKAHCLAINPTIQYHFCNETLRGEFYKHNWSHDKCHKHSIFISQAGYPIKGLHKVIEALPYVLKVFPDTVVYVAGKDITSKQTLKDRLRRGGYGKYIKKLLSRYNLEDKIIFKGFLDESEICNQYLQANLFICPSSIENSPNSLGEAQLLGVPCLASYVGGVPDMMIGFENNLYRFEETEMLADKICAIFDNTKFENKNMKREAFKRHDSENNVLQLIEIYNNIYS